MCTIGKERFLCRTSLLHCLTKQCTYTISTPFSNNFALKVFWKWIFLATGRLRLHSPRGQYYLDFLLDFLEFFPARNQLYRENVHIATLLALIRSCLFILILVKIPPARLIEPACVVGTPEYLHQKSIKGIKVTVIELNSLKIFDSCPFQTEKKNMVCTNLEITWLNVTHHSVVPLCLFGTVKKV